MLEDRGGRVWNLLETAPRRISTEFHKQFKDSLVQSYVQKKVPADADVATFGLWWELFQRQLPLAGLSFREQQLVRKVFCDALVTGEKLKGWGYSGIGNCPYCGRPDICFHRIWECPHGQSIRSEVFGHILEEARSHPTHPLFARLWAAKPEIPRPAQDWDIEMINQHGPCRGKTFDPDIPVFVDGSTIDPSHLEISRGGLAAVQLNAEGELLLAVRSHLPADFPQTPAHSENAGLAVAHIHSTFPRSAPFVVDCAALLKGTRSPGAVLAGNCFFGEFWRTIGLHLPPDQWTQLRKTKAHRDRANVEDSEFGEWLGNRAADWHAGEAAKKHALSRQEAEAHVEAVEAYTALLNGVGRILGEWPRATDMWPEAQPRPPKGRDRPFST